MILKQHLSELINFSSREVIKKTMAWRLSLKNQEKKHGRIERISGRTMPLSETLYYHLKKHYIIFPKCF